jgi:hypothetical protein
MAVRFWGAAVVVVMASGACAGEIVCMNPGANASTIYRAQGIASRILKEADVKVEFKGDERVCETLANAIVIAVSHQTPNDRHPGALAYAMPFERTRIVVFYDRVQTEVRAEAVPSLLGHVLAHEIGHMLQGVEHHSATGVMKQKWGAGDYAEMQRKPLRFSEEDLMMIRQGLRERASRQAVPAVALR